MKFFLIEHYCRKRADNSVYFKTEIRQLYRVKTVVVIVLVKLCLSYVLVVK